MLETPTNRQRETEITQALCAAWNCKSGSMGPYSPFDRYLHRDGRLTAIIEIKDRQNRRLDSYSTVYLDLGKYYTLMFAELNLRVPGLFVTSMQDGIWYVRVGSIPVAELPILVKGREDRQIDADIKPAIQIPIRFFKRVRDG